MQQPNSEILLTIITKLANQIGFVIGLSIEC